MEQENGMGLGELLHRVYLAIRRRIVLVLAVIFIITGGGFIIANIRKPMYTASERVSYTASDNMTSSYFQTVTAFCNKGCVVDRANFYYDYYSKKEYKKVSDFLDDVKKAQKDDSLYYTVDKRVKDPDRQYITGNNVGVSASSNSNSVSYIFTIRYTDADENAARDKLMILLQAISDEINVKEEGDFKYFGVEINISDMGYEYSASDWPKSKIISIAFIIGVFVALLSVYFINLTDRTVKEKADIERITGSDLLAIIEDQGA